MRCKIIRAEDDHILNIRHSDEIAEQYGLSALDADSMEYNLKHFGRYWLDAFTIIKPAN